MRIATWLAVTAAAASPAAAQGPTSQPDDWAAVQRKLKKLQGIAHKIDLSRWGDERVEDFAAPPKGNPWRVQNARAEHKNGRWVISAGKNRAVFWAEYKLPDELADARGVRIQANIEADGVDGIPQLGMFVGPRGQQLMQWDYIYYFAYSAQGRMQMLQLHRRTRRNGMNDELKANEKIEVVLELADGHMLGQRDGKSPLLSNEADAFKLGKGQAVGFLGRVGELRVSRLSFRPLEQALDDEARAKLWKDAPFPGPDELTAFLRQTVVPRLDDERYDVRQQASEMLWSLKPLSQRAVELALKGARGEELRARLQSLVEMSRMVTIEPLKPAPAKKDPPKKDDPPGKDDSSKQAPPPSPPSPAPPAPAKPAH